jgi:hypothetical protein
MTDDEPAENATPQLSGTYSASFSAASTTAYGAARFTTPIAPSQRPWTLLPELLLDLEGREGPHVPGRGQPLVNARH